MTITDTTYKYITQTAENKFIIYSTDEDEIIKQIEQKTKLDKDKIKRAIKFKKKEPVRSEIEDDMTEEAQPSPSLAQLGYITKVNGSIILRLG